MTASSASAQRWLPALVLPLLALVTVAVLSGLAKLGEPTDRLEPQPVSSPSAQASASPSASSRLLPEPVARAPLARRMVAEAREPKPELRKGFSPVLEREELAREPSGDNVIANPPRTEPPSAREIEVVPSPAPTSFE